MGLFFDEEEMFEIAKKLKSSTNYHFCNEYLPSLFFHLPRVFIGALEEKKKALEIVKKISDIMKNDGYDVELLREVDATARIDRGKKVIAIIFSLPNPKLETECNFVSTAFFESDLKYFESELYNDGSFGLCGRDAKGNHINYGKCEDIKTFNDMWTAIKSMKE